MLANYQDILQDAKDQSENLPIDKEDLSLMDCENTRDLSCVAPGRKSEVFPGRWEEGIGVNGLKMV